MFPCMFPSSQYIAWIKHQLGALFSRTNKVQKYGLLDWITAYSNLLSYIMFDSEHICSLSAIIFAPFRNVCISQKLSISGIGRYYFWGAFKNVLIYLFSHWMQTVKLLQANKPSLIAVDCDSFWTRLNILIGCAQSQVQRH